MIDGCDEEVYDKILSIYEHWIFNCIEDNALILISSITAWLASKNPKKCGKLIPEIINRILLVDKDDQGNVTKSIRNLSNSHTSFSVKVLKELIFYC